MAPENPVVPVLWIWLLAFGASLLCPAQAWPLNPDIQLGGHVKAQSLLIPSDPGQPDSSLNQAPFLDSFLELRLNAIVYGADSWDLEIHYENLALVKERDTSNAAWTAGESWTLPTDARRALSLTRILEDDGNRVVFHRIDRLALTLNRDWGSLRVGRQALTWGNGLVFNPMDLFNPFSPTDLTREYKTGDDMAWLQVNTGTFGEAQFLAVARRDEDTKDLETDASSFAARYRFMAKNLEIASMAARHHRDVVIGAGLAAPVGNALFRSDMVYTHPDESPEHGGFVSFVANLDYSWTWWNKNFYGLLEIFHNGAGRTDYSAALTDPLISTRLARGEIFTLGPWYLATRVEMEVHPLVTVSAAFVANPSDPSAIVQPRVVWNALENLRVTVGADLYSGGFGTEFGGFSLEGTDLTIDSADTVYAWITWYF